MAHVRVREVANCFQKRRRMVDGFAHARILAPPA
jgi:hypothetical protein